MATSFRSSPIRRSRGAFAHAWNPLQIFLSPNRIERKELS